MKKLFCIVMIILMLPAVFAEEVEISVDLNEYNISKEANHVMINEDIYVVCKDLVLALGGTIEWTAPTQIVKMTFDDQIIELQIDNPMGRIDGEFVDIHYPPILREGKTMLPASFIESFLGCDVTWNKETYHLDIVKEGYIVPEIYRSEKTYTDEDLYYLAKIVTVESGNQSAEMALAIANTVLNRVKDDRFPNTVKDVIFQIDRYVQFPPAHKASFKDLEPSEMATIAAKKALEGINNIGYSLYFNNAPFKSKANDLIEIIDGEYFYY